MVRFISEAKNTSALYLADTLEALLPHFENAVRTDYPGEMATEALRAEADMYRRDIEVLKTQVHERAQEVRDAKTNAEIAESRQRYAEQKIKEIQKAAKDIANLL